jgi:hypothetical protein
MDKFIYLADHICSVYRIITSCGFKNVFCHKKMLVKPEFRIVAQFSLLPFLISRPSCVPFYGTK